MRGWSSRWKASAIVTRSNDPGAASKSSASPVDQRMLSMPRRTASSRADLDISDSRSTAWTSLNEEAIGKVALPGPDARSRSRPEPSAPDRRSRSAIRSGG